MDDILKIPKLVYLGTTREACLNTGSWTPSPEIFMKQKAWKSVF